MGSSSELGRLRLLSFVCAAAASGALVTGCGGSDSPAPAPAPAPAPPAALLSCDDSMKTAF